MQTLVDAIPSNLAEAVGAVLSVLVALLVGWLKGKNNANRDHTANDRP